MYYYTFKVNRGDVPAIYEMVTSPKEPAMLLDDKRPNRTFISMLLNTPQFDCYSIDQIQDMEMMICRTDSQIPEI